MCPLRDQKSRITRRIEKSLKSIRYVLDQGGRLLLASHFGRPKGKDEKFSLQKVAQFLSETYGFEVIFVEELEALVLKELFLGLKEKPNPFS